MIAKLLNKYLGSYLSYFLMYLCYFGSLALFSGLISIYLMDKGYKATHVSMVVSLSFIFSMVVQPVIGYLNDHYNHKYVNSILLTCLAFLGVIFTTLDNIYLIAIVYSIVLAVINGTNPMIERMAVLSHHKYGSIRIWGTIGYAIASQISGVVYRYISSESVYICFAIVMVICVIGILGTSDKEETNQEVDEVVQDRSKKAIWHKEMMIYLVIVFIFYGVTNVHSTYLPAFLTHNGLSIDTATTVIFLATLFEIPVIYFGSRYIDRIANRTLLMLALLLIMIEFFTLSFINIIAIQIIVLLVTKAVATMSFIMINMKVVASIVDGAHQMSALAIVATVKSLTSIAFQFVGGYLISYYNYQMFYIVLLVVSVLGFFVCCLYKIKPGKGMELFD